MAAESVKRWIGAKCLCNDPVQFPGIHIHGHLGVANVTSNNIFEENPTLKIQGCFSLRPGPVRPSRRRRGDRIRERRGFWVSA